VTEQKRFDVAKQVINEESLSDEASHPEVEPNQSEWPALNVESNPSKLSVLEVNPSESKLPAQVIEFSGSKLLDLEAEADGLNQPDVEPELDALEGIVDELSHPPVLRSLEQTQSFGPQKIMPVDKKEEERRRRDQEVLF